VYWIGVAWDRDQWRALRNVVMNLLVPWYAGKFLSGCTTGGPFGSAQLRGVSYLIISSGNWILNRDAIHCFGNFLLSGHEVMIGLSVIISVPDDADRHWVLTSFSRG
jgi:hypothetical protein